MVLLRSTPFVQDGMRATQRRSILESLANEQGPQLDPMRNANFSDGSGIDPQGEGFDPYNTTPPVRPPLDMTTLRPDVNFSPIENKRGFTPAARDPSLEKEPSFLDKLAADLEMAIPGMHGIMTGARTVESMTSPTEGPPTTGGGALQDALARMRGSFGDARKSWSAGVENIKNAGDAPRQAMERARSTVSEASANLDANPYWNPPDGFYELMKAKGSEAYNNLSGSLSQGAENFRQARYAPGLALRRADDTINGAVANLEQIASVNDGSAPASPTIANTPVANTIPVAPADRPPQAGPARLNTGPVPMAPLAQLAAEQADMSMPGNMAHTLRIQNGPFESSVNYVNGKARSLGAPGRAGVDVPSGDDMTLARLQRELFGQQERDLNKQETGYEDVPGARRLAAMLNPTQAGSPGMNLEGLSQSNNMVNERRRQDIGMRQADAQMVDAEARRNQSLTNRMGGEHDLAINLSNYDKELQRQGLSPQQRTELLSIRAKEHGGFLKIARGAMRSDDQPQGAAPNQVQPPEANDDATGLQDTFDVFNQASSPNKLADMLLARPQIMANEGLLQRLAKQLASAAPSDLDAINRNITSRQSSIYRAPWMAGYAARAWNPTAANRNQEGMTALIKLMDEVKRQQNPLPGGQR